MASHRRSALNPRFGRRAALCLPPPPFRQRASTPGDRTAGAHRTGHAASRSHPFGGIPRPAASAPERAQNRNPQSSSPLDRGFVPRRLSYACRHPKLSTASRYRPFGDGDGPPRSGPAAFRGPHPLSSEPHSGVRLARPSPTSLIRPKALNWASLLAEACGVIGDIVNKSARRAPGEARDVSGVGARPALRDRVKDRRKNLRISL